MTSSDVATLLRARLAQEPDLHAAWLFGSEARGEARADSDVDVALLTGTPPRALAHLKLDLAADLAQLLGREVDVVVLDDADPDLIHRLLAQGELLIEPDRSARIASEVESRNRHFDMQPVWQTTDRAGDDRPRSRSERDDAEDVVGPDAVPRWLRGCDAPRRGLPWRSTRAVGVRHRVHVCGLRRIGRAGIRVRRVQRRVPVVRIELRRDGQSAHGVRVGGSLLRTAPRRHLALHGLEPTGPYLGTFLENVAAYGSMPVGPEAVYPIAVTYDAARTYAEPGLVCEEGGRALVCSARVFQPPTFGQQGDDRVATFTGQLGTRTVTVMLVLRATEDAPATARAYYYIAADFSPPMGTCEDAGTPEGIVTGQVFLNQPPAEEGTRGEASLVLPDGTGVVVFSF